MKFRLLTTGNNSSTIHAIPIYRLVHLYISIFAWRGVERRWVKRQRVALVFRKNSSRLPAFIRVPNSRPLVFPLTAVTDAFNYTLNRSCTRPPCTPSANICRERRARLRSRKAQRKLASTLSRESSWSSYHLPETKKKKYRCWAQGDFPSGGIKGEAVVLFATLVPSRFVPGIPPTPRFFRGEPLDERLFGKREWKALLLPRFRCDR